MALFEGIAVTLYERTEIGRDAFNAPVYAETPVQVENVLVAPVNSGAVIGDVQLHGKRAECELYIPARDDHTWEDRRVDFFGRSWRTVGFAEEWSQNRLPLGWNKRIKAERYG